MRAARAACCVFVLVACLRAAEERSGAEISAALRQISIDPETAYHVRDLELTRGDLKLYFTEGILALIRPVAGRRIGAVFTTDSVEAGDAEILALPPRASERASLARFAKSPNLDEHFFSAVFFFSDNTAAELLNEIEAKEVRKASDVAAQLAPRLDPWLRSASEGIDVRLAQALLDRHDAAHGFFYGLIGGRDLGSFDVVYEPNDFEPVSIGRAMASDGEQKFQLWTSFRPRHAPPYARPAARVKEYRVDTTIQDDLSMSVAAAFDWIAGEEDGRVIPLGLSERLKVESAAVDGAPAEVLERQDVGLAELKRGRTFLIIAGRPLEGGTTHKIVVRYSGTVVRRTRDGSYFVDERNAWYPYTSPTLANFDLTFHLPARLRLVSTGEPVSEEVRGADRTVHRRTQIPEALAGFNLGEYQVTEETRGPYRVECYANASAAEAMADIPEQTANVLDYYTERWTKLPIRDIAVSPIPGYLGQGFPGLIYLSSISYVREEKRPAELRNPRMDAFFSQLLLPHEVAHQWWGSIVFPADYRAGWIVEAMANDSALEYMAHRHEASAIEAVLDGYRDDLLFEQNGKRIEAAGPVDFGTRLRDTGNEFVWHAITYEKGAWIFRMLRERLGNEGFRQMQVRLLEQFATKPLTNEDLRSVASQFVPEGQPDRTLSLFFDTWVYGTGIPKLELKRTKAGAELDVSAVDEDFAADVPLDCTSKDGKRSVRWVRASAGTNELEAGNGWQTCGLPARYEFLYSK